jgi:hypothetical protein
MMLEDVHLTRFECLPNAPPPDPVARAVPSCARLSHLRPDRDIPCGDRPESVLTRRLSGNEIPYQRRESLGQSRPIETLAPSLLND